MANTDTVEEDILDKISCWQHRRENKDDKSTPSD